jgi:hypothetical protein
MPSRRRASKRRRLSEDGAGACVAHDDDAVGARPNHHIAAWRSINQGSLTHAWRIKFCDAHAGDCIPQRHTAVSSRRGCTLLYCEGLHDADLSQVCEAADSMEVGPLCFAARALGGLILMCGGKRR